MAHEIERVWVEHHLPRRPCRIFNFGSYEDEGDDTVERFTSLGYRVVGVDLRNDKRVISGYEFHRGDILEMDFDECFDCIYAVSSIEHVGLDCYGNMEKDVDGDIRVVKRLYSLLNPWGVLLLTVPYGGYVSGQDWRVYTRERLNQLVQGFSCSLEFFGVGWRSMLEAVLNVNKKDGEMHKIAIEKTVTGLDLNDFWVRSFLSVVIGQTESYPDIWALSQHEAGWFDSVACIRIWKDDD